MIKQAGLCYDPRTRKYKHCGKPNPVKRGAPPPPPGCCLTQQCCLSCDDLNAIRICFQKNLQIFFQQGDLGNGQPVTPSASQLVRQWGGFGRSGLPGTCDTWRPDSNQPPSGLLKNGNQIPCYQITAGTNTDVPINYNEKIPVGLVFTTNDPANCKDFGVFLLIEPVDLGGGFYSFNVISSKYCINYLAIISVNDYNNICDSCTEPPRTNPSCQILVSDNASGGISQFLDINIGSFFLGSNPTVDRFSLIIPPCCNFTINDSNITITQNTGFANATAVFSPAPPSGPGTWDIFISLINANIPGPGTTVIEINSLCGNAKITLNYEITS